MTPRERDAGRGGSRATARLRSGFTPREETTLDIQHVREFTAAMQRKDLKAMLGHMSERIVLETPLLEAPVKGKSAIREVVSALLKIVDRFDFQELMQGPEHVSSFFQVTIGPWTLDGMDYWTLDGTGRIEHMKVLWRPLPAIAAVQRRLDGSE
jgi:hypothetical protein